MDSHRWQQIKAVLDRALALESAERAAFVADACGGDRELRAEVESLLASDTVSADALEGDAFSILSDKETIDKFIGRTVGKFTLRSKIADGGMGSVYFAERTDGEFSQRAAVKLIRSGIHSDTIRRRFLNERQILATLSHPNIAQIIDGGTTDDGYPYLAMEYVEGKGLMEYVRDKNLSVTERLDLFRDICEAVSFAHRSLVIHRDLKPANILITADGTPKLLDFGIAKLLSAESDGNTMTQQIAFTPDYASPEQLLGETLTTATDVYSLGVILYELLTGVRPFSFRDKSYADILSTATKSEPKRPSSAATGESIRTTPEAAGTSARQHISSDLDTIILKALRKDPQRRYASVDQFSEDIQRYLRGLPIAARKDSVTYRAKKFAQRNPLVVASVSVALIVLVVGILATLYQARQANIERERAERRFNDVRALANSIIFEVNEKIDESPIRAREMLVQRALEYLDKLSQEAALDETLRAELAAAYEKIAEIQSEHYGSGTGDTRGALENHRKALAMREALAASSHSNVDYALAASSSRRDVADIIGTLGDVSGGLELYRQDLEQISELSNRYPDNEDVLMTLARCHAKVGQGTLRTGSFNKALEHYDQSIAIIRKVLNANPGDEGSRYRLSGYLQYSAFVLLDTGRVADGLKQTSEALEIQTARFASDAENTDRIRDQINVEVLHGVALKRIGRFSESVGILELALERQQRIADLDPSNLGDVNGLADCHLELGMALRDAGNTLAARRHLEEAIDLYGKVAAADSSNVSAKGQIAFTRHNLADTLRRANLQKEATAAFRKGIVDAETALASDPNNRQFQHDRAVCQINLFELRAATREELLTALSTLENLHRESPEHLARKQDLEKARRLAAA